MNIHIKTALGYLRRSPFQAMAATFVLSLTFFVATLVSVLVYSSSQLISYFETRPQVIAFLKDNVSENEIADLQHKLEADGRVKEIKYVSKSEALSIYKKSTINNPLLGELVSPTTFPPSLEFSLSDLSFAQGVIDEVKGEKIVGSVGFTASIGEENRINDVVSRLRTVTTYIRVGGAVFVGMLALTSFVVLLIIISMRITTRRDEVEILDLIGATQGFIRGPIIIEALLYAFLGVIVGWSVAFISILYLAPSAVTYFQDIPVLPRDTFGLLQLFGVIVGIELILGFVLAISGSLFAVSRVKSSR